MKPGAQHSSHWGAFRGAWSDDQLSIVPHAEDPAPSPLLQNMAAAPRSRARVLRPMVRRGWLENGPGPDARRGYDDFVELPWETALDLVAAELRRVLDRHSAEAIFGGSYGWSSAGRFHHAQSQVHRFLNMCVGGYVRSVNTYSDGAADVILRRVVGGSTKPVNWWEVVDHTELLVAFGGLPARNKMIANGGNTHRVTGSFLGRASDRGARFVSITPIRDDIDSPVPFEWTPIRPGSDTAMMLALAYELAIRGLHDRTFLDRYCVGYDSFEEYLLGKSDGVAKSAAWAEVICQLPATHIVDLAIRMAKSRTLINVGFSVQRAERGEQPVWMAVVLGAMLGQIGLPGGGVSVGLASGGNLGKPPVAVPIPTLPQGENCIETYIPVARIADMLLRPGETYDYDGNRLRYPDIKLVYWAGGNPFHHHQDLQRLEAAFARPDTVIVHDPFVTATAKFADFILPSTLTMERDDFGAAGSDPKLFAMRKLMEPAGEARNDYDIFSDLAGRLDRRSEFTEGRTDRQWLVHLYERTRAALCEAGLAAPSFEAFWELEEMDLPLRETRPFLSEFRSDPVANPIATPSGKIEIFSDQIDGFGYDDCRGHPVWFDRREWLGSPRAAQFPLQLVANQPSARLHSQLDFGDYSQSRKISGREPARIHPQDAMARDIRNGDIVRIFNDRGSCLAGVRLCPDMVRGVVQISTGAWYDRQDLPGGGSACVHGNPNILTEDVGTSRLAQGCCGQLVLVDLERFDGELPALKAFEQPGKAPFTADLMEKAEAFVSKTG